MWSQLSFELVFPYSNMSFLSGCLQDFFSLLLVFRNVVMLCLHMHFLEYILFGFFSASWACTFAKFGKFQLLLLQILFSLAVFLSFWDANDTYVDLLSLGLRLHAFPPQFIFSLLLRLGKCYFLLISSILCNCHCTTEPIQWDFYFC